VKFIIDANLPVSLGESLATKGHNVKYARNLLPVPATDEAIYQLACREKRIILTRDLDFGNIVVFDARKTGAIIVLRTFLLPIPKIHDIVINLLATLTEKELSGRLIIAEPHRFRVHTPPPEQ